MYRSSTLQIKKYTQSVLLLHLKYTENILETCSFFIKVYFQVHLYHCSTAQIKTVHTLQLLNFKIYLKVYFYKLQNALQVFSILIHLFHKFTCIDLVL